MKERRGNDIDERKVIEEKIWKRKREREEKKKEKRDKPGYKVIQRPDPNSSLFFLSDMYLAFFFFFFFFFFFALLCFPFYLQRG